jgi:hypothetical protein
MSVSGILAPIIWGHLYAVSISKDVGWQIPGLSFIFAGVLTILALIPAVRVFRKLPDEVIGSR